MDMAAAGVGGEGKKEATTGAVGRGGGAPTRPYRAAAWTGARRRRVGLRTRRRARMTVSARKGAEKKNSNLVDALLSFSHPDHNSPHARP
jgi:hypothetical protein